MEVPYGLIISKHVLQTITHWVPPPMVKTKTINNYYNNFVGLKKVQFLFFLSLSKEILFFALVCLYYAFNILTFLTCYHYDSMFMHTFSPLRLFL